MKSQRRQNTSCDPCRRSKRRCFFLSPDDRESGAACANCRRLGHSCTFEFVASKSRSSKGRRQSRAASHQSSQWDCLDVLGQAFEGNTSLSNEETPTTTQDILSSIDTEQYYSIENDTNLFDSLIFPHSQTTETSEVQSQISSSSPNRLFPIRTPSLRDAQSIVGSSPKSPIYLLNTNLNATIIDERLAQIHDTIIRGCAARFADYDCNLYAKPPGYQLERTGNAQVQTLNDVGYRMTSVGIVRFLDHFSDLYGNHLSPPARKQSDAVLKAVLRVFSMQWLPISENSSSMHDSVVTDIPSKNQAASDVLMDVFNDAWFEARSLIQKTQHIRSFRLVYAIFLFDGITIPTKGTESIVAHEFLDQSLDNLFYLDQLVKRYCNTLGSQSIYSTFLEASISVVRWCGYIRDIGASLMTNRQSKYPGASSPVFDDPSYSSGVEVSFEPNKIGATSSLRELIEDWLSYPASELDNHTPSLCRKAVAEAFFVWGRIIEAKNSMLESTRLSSLPNAISSAVTATGKFNRLFRPFMARCVKDFEHFSIHSKTSAISIVIFWDLGVFILAELMKTIIENGVNVEPSLVSNVHGYRIEAVSSVVRALDRALSFPTEDVFNLQNGLGADVPIIGYHITPRLTATTLEKAIENIIDLRFTSIDVTEYQQDGLSNMSAEDDWKQQVDTIMKGLSSLSVTVGGSQVADVAFKSLLRRHGDILSECWSSDFDT